MGFVRCNIANSDSVSLYSTLCSLVLVGGGYLLLGMILNISFERVSIGYHAQRKTYRFYLIRHMRITHNKDSLNAAIIQNFHNCSEPLGSLSSEKK